MTLTEEIRDAIDMVSAAQEAGGELPLAYLMQIERTLERCFIELGKTLDKNQGLKVCPEKS